MRYWRSPCVEGPLIQQCVFNKLIIHRCLMDYCKLVTPRCTSCIMVILGHGHTINGTVSYV